MLELLGLALAGFVMIFVVGFALKLTWFLASLIFLPLKILLSIGTALLAAALILFFLPFTLLALLALLGGFAFVTLGTLSILP